MSAVDTAIEFVRDSAVAVAAGSAALISIQGVFTLIRKGKELIEAAASDGYEGEPEDLDGATDLDSLEPYDPSDELRTERGSIVTQEVLDRLEAGMDEDEWEAWQDHCSAHCLDAEDFDAMDAWLSEQEYDPSEEIRSERGSIVTQEVLDRLEAGLDEDDWEAWQDYCSERCHDAQDLDAMDEWLENRG